MQSVIDSLCRCFGSTPMNPDMMDIEASSIVPSQEKQVPATPDMRRRTRSLALQDKQWDALFFSDPAPTQSRTSSLHLDEGSVIAIEQAQALAKAKLAANPSRVRAHKRKRSSSKDEIFRNKRPDRAENASGQQYNVFSRFLSSHPVIAQSLCFATPIKDSNDEPDEVPMADNNSVVSGNTLNTAEDTISSTVYYENTKLAGLQQKTPPMPLFNSFQVDERDDIHHIVATHSHSSAMLRDLVREIGVGAINLEEDDEDDEEDEDDDPTPPTTPHRRRSENDDARPPPMTNSSSESSQRSDT